MVLATVLCTATFVAAASDAAGAARTRVGTDSAHFAVVTVHHARECASVRKAGGGTIVVPVVIDLGGPSDQANVTCVAVPAGSNDAQVLAARAKLLGVTAPRYAISGLLCAIDDYPATGCGQQNGSHYAYWAYFHGGSSWTYSSVGPASWTVSAGDVEGWRFEPDGSATPADPPPRSPSDAPTLCPASVPPTTTTTTSPASVPTSTATSTTLAQSSSSSGNHGATGPGSAPAVSSGPKPFVAAPGSGGPVTAKGSGSAPGAVSTTTTPGPPGGAAQQGAGSDRAGHRTPTHLASKRSPGHGGFPLGIIIAVALIALFATGAGFRTRRSTKAD